MMYVLVGGPTPKRSIASVNLVNILSELKSKRLRLKLSSLSAAAAAATNYAVCDYLGN